MLDRQRLMAPDALPRHVLERADVAAACSTHDFATLFVLIKRYGGVSQNRIAAALDLSPSRVGEIVHGRRRITSMEVISRISDRFAIPGRMLGLAARPWETASADDMAAAALVTLGESNRIPAGDITHYAGLLGDVVDLDRRIDIDISDDGSARLSFHYQVLNLTNRPLARLPRDLWFKHTEGPLLIAPLDRESGHRVSVQRVHDTPNLAKFACLVSPPISPGESAVVAYHCSGGRFVDSLYWRQAVSRHTRRLVLRLRQHGAGRLRICTAVKEYPDGTERSMTESLTWDTEHGDIVVVLVADCLRPGQAVTLRWEIDREPA